jgi:flagellar biosynthesis/type III secretory pathway M-ring protein FliF/YscJ
MFFQRGSKSVMVMFDPTITLGAIIEVTSLVVTAIVFFVVLDQKNKALEEKTEEHHKDNEKRFAGIENELKQQTPILVSIARQEERIRHIEARVFLNNRRVKDDTD